MRPLVVYGDSYGRTRRIVAARTKKEAAALLGISMVHFRNYVDDTGNEEEIAVATAAPGVVFETPHSSTAPGWGEWRVVVTQ